MNDQETEMKEVLSGILGYEVTESLVKYFIYLDYTTKDGVIYVDDKEMTNNEVLKEIDGDSSIIRCEFCEKHFHYDDLHVFTDGCMYLCDNCVD